MQGELAELRSRLESVTEARDRARQEVEGLRRELADAAAARTSAETRTRDLAEQLEAARQAQRERQAELDAQRSRADKAESHAGDLAEEVDGPRTDAGRSAGAAAAQGDERE